MMKQIAPWRVRRWIQGGLFIIGGLMVAFNVVDEEQAQALIAELAPILMMFASGFAGVHIDRNSDTPPDVVAERAARRAREDALRHSTPESPSMGDIMRNGGV